MLGPIEAAPAPGEGWPRSLLLLTERFPPHPGGLARASRRLARHAATAGVAVHVVVTRAEGLPGSVQTAPDDGGGFWVHRFGAERATPEGMQQLSLVLDWLHCREHFEVVHGQYGSTCGFLAAWHATLWGIASHVSLRGNDLDRDLYDPERFASLTWALERAGSVGAVSRHLAAAAGKLVRREVLAMPNAVDLQVFRPVDDAAQLRTSLALGTGPVLGFAGEVRRKKGIGYLLEAFRATERSHPEAVLLLVGSIRPEERELLEGFIRQFPTLGARVRLVPYVHDEQRLAAIYGAMDLFVLPSLWEGMPNALLEAMACGLPVLASDAGGIPDVVRHGENGWIVSRHDLHRLGEAIEEILSLAPEQRRAVGNKARQSLQPEFTPEAESERLRRAYAAALAASRE